MDIEIKGQFQEEMDRIEYLDVERLSFNRGSDEIEMSESENGILIIKNPEQDLKTSVN